MSRDRFRFQGDAPHFLTCSVVKWLPVFDFPEAVQIILDCFCYLQEQERMSLYGYVIMKDHLHFIAESQNLGKTVGSFKSFTARQILDLLKREKQDAMLGMFAYHRLGHKKDRKYQLWQEGSHPIVMQSEEVLRQRLVYMHGNPVRKGYVETPEQWVYSSARDYAGMTGVLEIRGRGL